MAGLQESDVLLLLVGSVEVLGPDVIQMNAPTRAAYGARFLALLAATLKVYYDSEQKTKDPASLQARRGLS